MSAQVLDRVLFCYRIGDPAGQYPVFSYEGSRLFPGRWNTPSSPMIYCSEHYSNAMLEKLVHGSGQMPPDQHSVEITIPPGVTYEQVTVHSLKDWDHQDRQASRALGEQWFIEKRSLILLVPSVVARMERNVLINPFHPDFVKVTHGEAEPVRWDDRLFSV